MIKKLSSQWKAEDEIQLEPILQDTEFNIAKVDNAELIIIIHGAMFNVNEKYDRPMMLMDVFVCRLLSN